MDLGSTNKTFLNVSGSSDILSSFLLIIVLAFVLCMSKLRYLQEFSCNICFVFAGYCN